MLSESVLLQKVAIAFSMLLILAQILQIPSVYHVRVDIGIKRMIMEIMDLVKKVLIVKHPLWHSQ